MKKRLALILSISIFIVALIASHLIISSKTEKPAVKVTKLELPSEKITSLKIFNNDLYYALKTDIPFVGYSDDPDKKDSTQDVYRIPLDKATEKQADQYVQKIFESKIASFALPDFFYEKKGSLYFQYLNGHNASMSSGNTYKINANHTIEPLLLNQIMDFDFIGEDLVFIGHNVMEISNNLYLVRKGDDPENISDSLNAHYWSFSVIGESIYTNASYSVSPDYPRRSLPVTDYDKTFAKTTYKKLYRFDLNHRVHQRVSEYNVEQFFIVPEIGKIYFTSLGEKITPADTKPSSYDQNDPNFSPCLYSMDIDGSNIELEEEINISYLIYSAHKTTKHPQIFYSLGARNGLFKKDLLTGETVQLLSPDSQLSKDFEVINHNVIFSVFSIAGNDLHIISEDNENLFSTNENVSAYDFNGKVAVYKSEASYSTEKGIYMVDLINYE